MATPYVKTNNSSSSKTMKFKTMDDNIVEMEVGAAMVSNTIKEMMENVRQDDNDTEAIPIQVSGLILAKIAEWAEQHKNDAPVPVDAYEDKLMGDISEWDQKFLNEDEQTLFELILAANYLDIKVLFEMACKKVSTLMEGKSVLELRKMFNLQTDVTPVQERQILEENKWCFAD